MQHRFKFIYRQILPAIALFILTLLGGESGMAQTAQDILSSRNEDNTNAYGTNPYESEEEDGEESSERSNRDSLKPRIIKPLESYYFNDEVRAQHNFKWNVDRNFNRVHLTKIDTTLTDLRIDYPYYRDGVGDMTLGGLGQATQAIDYFDRANYENFSFAQPFDAYIFTMDNAPFYNVKSPFTLFSYGESGQKIYRESSFGLTHAQNINPSTGFTLDYKARSTKGLYQRQDTKNHNLALTFSHTGKRYSVHAGYINNSIETEENGGVVGLWTIRDSLFEMPIGIPTKLGDAEASNEYHNNSFFIEQAYGLPLEPMDDYDFSMANKSAVYIGHSFEYNSWSRVYRDIRATYTDDRAEVNDNGDYVSKEYEYYDNWFIDPDQTQDSIRERVISNRLFIQAQPWDRDGVVGTVNGGIGVDFKSYSQFAFNSYLSSNYQTVNETDVFIYGAVEGKLRRYLDWNGDVKIYSIGERAGDLSVGADITLTAYIQSKPIKLSGSFRTELTSPSYWEENLFSNHFVFQNALEKESSTRINAKLEIPDVNLELGLSEVIVSDLIYYDINSNIAQEGSAISLTSLYLRKRFELGKFNLDHRILGQWSTNEDVVSIPMLSAYLSYYYEFDVVKDVLRLQIGADGRYTSKYYAPDYNPALSTFVNQREAEIGEYPYVDLFVAGKWKRMRLYLKYQHISQSFVDGGEYFYVANYPLNPGMFKFGFSWGFYD